MMEQKKGSYPESWRELAEEWGPLGTGYHCTPFSNVIIFATEVNLSLNQTSRQTCDLTSLGHSEASP